METKKIVDYIKNHLGCDKNFKFYKIEKTTSKKKECSVYEMKQISEQYIANIKKQFSNNDIVDVSYVKNRYRSLIYEKYDDIKKFYTENNNLVLVAKEYVLIENNIAAVNQYLIPILKSYPLSEKITETQIKTKFGNLVINNTNNTFSINFNTKNLKDGDIAELVELFSL